MDVRDHGWFVFFAPRDNPEIAGVVFAEHAEHGANAAPIAKYTMETYFAKKEGRPLPTLSRRLPTDTRPGRDPGHRGPQPAGGGLEAAVTAMFERRLYFHIDWLLLGAILLLAAASASR